MTQYASIDTDTQQEAQDRAQRLEKAGRDWSSRIDQDPAQAGLVFRTRGEGIGSVATRITSGRHELVLDEPAALAGDDAGTSPVEAALAGLISCQVVIYRLYAQQLGIELEDISIEAEGDLDVRGLLGGADEVRPGFSEVRLNVSLTGPESSERYVELQRTVDEHCPVMDIFRNPVPVQVQVSSSAS
ncbi:OsmC family protein [Nesterenkonia sp. HG001]|uniref:OsmC family protein n=1 Tax=Nesterenkonia sp. HG001 TaxID=2983207 RepID=UPI002AC5D9A2|nr:OsmC family protein [Nesterenkonia sp. HG001]MDZ5079153.1 OsmC family protein [Nesterenkonia sp. HG001]